MFRAEVVEKVSTVVTLNMDLVSDGSYKSIFKLPSWWAQFDSLGTDSFSALVKLSLLQSCKIADELELRRSISFADFFFIVCLCLKYYLCRNPFMSFKSPFCELKVNEITHEPSPPGTISAIHGCEHKGTVWFAVCARNSWGPLRHPPALPYRHGSASHSSDVHPCIKYKETS